MRESAFLRLTTTAIAVFVLNALWAASLETASGRITAVFGTVIALAVVLSLYFSRRIRTGVLASPPEFVARRSRALAVVLPFFLPVLFLHATPVFGFWRFDARSALLVAWLISMVVAIGFETRRAEAVTSSTTQFLLVIFLLFSAGLWIAIVMDSGVTRYITEIDRRGHLRACQGDPFTTMTEVWESHPASEHLFLGWRSPGDFEHGTVYANHVHAYLLPLYAWMRAARVLGHVTVWQASNTTILLPIAVLVAAFITLLGSSGHLSHRFRAAHLLPLFMALGILITTWRLWIDLVRFNSDNPYPLLAGIFVLLYALLLPPIRTRAAAVAAALFAALSPTNTPMLILPLVCLFGQRGRDWRDVMRQNRSVLVVCLAALAAGAVSYLEPRILINWKNYHPQASSFLFRSGLDGDTRYFSGLLQAVAAPCSIECCYGRTLAELIMPFALPLVVLAPVVWWRTPSEGAWIGRAFLFLVTPYVMSVLLFPQSVSIHPYIYDHWLIIPVVVSGLLAMLSAIAGSHLRGATLLAFLLFVGVVLMSNLLGIAQGLARARAFFTS